MCHHTTLKICLSTNYLRINMLPHSEEERYSRLEAIIINVTSDKLNG